MSATIYSRPNIRPFSTRWTDGGNRKVPPQALLSRCASLGVADDRLKGGPGALEALATIGIDETRRAETVSVAEFVALARALTA